MSNRLQIASLVSPLLLFFAISQPVFGANTPEVSQANYGANCNNSQSDVTAPVQEWVAKNCAGKISCSISVQKAAAGVIGDHCPGVAKDFDVTYVCGDEEKTKHVPGEANTKTAFITCAKKAKD